MLTFGIAILELMNLIASALIHFSMKCRMVAVPEMAAMAEPTTPIALEIGLNCSADRWEQKSNFL